MFLNIKNNNEQKKAMLQNVLFVLGINPPQVSYDETDQQGSKLAYSLLYKRGIRAFYY